MRNHRYLLLSAISAGTLLTALGFGSTAHASPVLTVSPFPAATALFQTVDDDDDTPAEGRLRKYDDHDRAHGKRHHHHDDDDDDDDDGDDDHHRRDRDHRRDHASQPTTTDRANPPDNGLILKGSVPKVQVN